MPQCQVSSNRSVLTDAHKVDDDVWVCPGAPYSPGCAGGERYRRVTDARLHDYMERALLACAREFGRDPSAVQRPDILLFGKIPQTVRRGDLLEIYLHPRAGRGTDYQKLSGQIAHEAFHVVCSPSPARVRWSHELLAELFRDRFLNEIGFASYSERNTALLRGHAMSFSIEAMLAVGPEDWNYPRALYGRAFVTGEQLVATVGWEATKRLATALKDDGSPHIEGWLDTLEPRDAMLAREVLQGRIVLRRPVALPPSVR